MAVRKQSEAEAILAKYISYTPGIPEPEREYQFDIEKKRKWRFDFAWPEYHLAVEVDGGTWSGGRHVRGVGFEEDCRKLNAATLQGWHVLRYTTRMIRENIACVQIENFIKIARGVRP